MHRPSASLIRSWSKRTPERPLRLLFSACLAGEPCGVDGKPYGDMPWIKELLTLPTVKTVGFCPEHLAFGTPRRMPDIHGGNGFDVLDGKARVLNDAGEDWTDGMLRAAQAMLQIAEANQVELAILMDMSAACGSQVISSGCRFEPERVYQKGPGVAAALLIRHGIPVVSQRDFRTLGALRQALDPGFTADPQAIDHDETDWYREYFR